MLYLNDTYSLTEDPNSVSGVFWCLGRYDAPGGQSDHLRNGPVHEFGEHRAKSARGEYSNAMRSEWV